MFCICRNEWCYMPFRYTKLWKMMLEKNINKTQLRDSVGISNACLAKLSKNENVSMSTLDKICSKYHCDIGDIVEFVEET